MAGKLHRVKAAAQDPRLEESVVVEQDVEVRASHGHAMLRELHGKLSPRDQEPRKEAFDQAHEGVAKAAAIGGIPQDRRYPASKSYPQPPRRDHKRVDVEVWAGKALVPDPPAVDKANGTRK
jgi:hypothetical protein